MMRTKSLSSAGLSEKLYINNNTLAVTGEKITILAQPTRRIAIRRHRIEIGSTPSLNETQEEEKIKTKKATIKLKECVPLSNDVLSRQLKKIRETVRVVDFERLLIGLTGGKEKNHVRKRSTLDLISTEQLYYEYFGIYYELLHEVVRNRMSSIT